MQRNDLFCLSGKSGPNERKVLMPLNSRQELRTKSQIEAIIAVNIGWMNLTESYTFATAQWWKCVLLDWVDNGSILRQSVLSFNTFIIYGHTYLILSKNRVSHVVVRSCDLIDSFLLLLFACLDAFCSNWIVCKDLKASFSVSIKKKE